MPVFCQAPYEHCLLKAWKCGNMVLNDLNKLEELYITIDELKKLPLTKAI